MLADLLAIHATSKHWHDIEEEWRRENAGCCDGCGMPSVLAALQPYTCEMCRAAPYHPVRRDADRRGNIRDFDNAAWRRHDREIRARVSTIPAQRFTEAAILRFSQQPKRFEFSTNVDLDREWANIPNPLPRHPDWPKEEA